jgi:phage terminase large subunit-like protein
MTYDEKSNQWFWYWIKKLAKEEYNISLPIVALWYPNDKVAHFTPHIPHFIANRVYLPSRHKDLQEAETQLIAFPTKWVHDDFVDWLSWVLDNYIKIKEEPQRIITQARYF